MQFSMCEGDAYDLLFSISIFWVDVQFLRAVFVAICVVITYYIICFITVSCTGYYLCGYKTWKGTPIHCCITGREV